MHVDMATMLQLQVKGGIVQISNVLSSEMFDLLFK